MNSFVLGIDEVGRGPLAGPLVVCGVVLDTRTFPLYTFRHIMDQASLNMPMSPDLESKNLQVESRLSTETSEELVKDLLIYDQLDPIYKGVRDSKKVNKTKREKIGLFARESHINFLILESSNQEIDQKGIGVCLSDLVVQIIRYFEIQQNLDLQTTLLDGNIKLPPDFQTRSKIQKEAKSDDKYLSVAMASILAKVYRDKYMTQLALEYPEFAWDKNAGYGTKINIQAILQNPTNPYLRQSFLGNILTKA